MTQQQVEAIKSHVIVAAMLVGAVVLAYSPALYAGFVSADDPETVTNNPAIRGIDNQNVRAMFTTFTLGHYQPLALLSLAVDHVFWGLDPRGYHVTNIVLHAANAVLVYVLALRIFDRVVAPRATGAEKAAHDSRATTALTRDSAVLRWSASFAAAFYALHPLRVESVAWITERRDLLSLLFLLGATLSYITFSQTRRWPWYACCLGFLALSLLSKAWGMSFFLVLLLLDAYPLKRLPVSPLRWPRYGPVLAEKVPMMVLGVAAAFVASVAVRESLAAKSLEEWGVLSRCVQAAYGLWFYVWKTIVPSNLAVFYEIPNSFNPLERRFVAAYVALPAIGVALATIARHRPGVVTGFVAYAVLIAPVLGFLQSGDQLVADRYATIAGVPLSLMLGAGVLTAARSFGPSVRQVLIGSGAALILLLSYLTWKQSDVWHDSETLWRQAVRVTDGTTACEFLGQELEQQGRIDEAIESYQEALRRDPGNGQAMYYLGNLHAAAGRIAEAERMYRDAAPRMRQPYIAHMTLGMLYAKVLNRPAEADASFRAAAAAVEASKRPRPGERGMVYLGYGAFLRRSGRNDEAREWLNKALAEPESKAAAERELSAIGR